MARYLVLLAVLAAGVVSLQAQTNLALSATASQSAGGSGTYGPQNINDNVLTQGANIYAWVSTSSGTGNNTAYWQLTWSSTVNIASLRFYYESTTTRFMYSADVQYWDGSAWVTDHRYSISVPYSGGPYYTVNLTQTRSTTAFRLYNLYTYGTQSNNPNCVELQVYGPAGPTVST
ncbi:MAG: hypothetical protein HS108_13455, partial [Planctomycetes bacterium]|nr:hypothetical protein [Planctomycetota bacterium]